MVSQSHFRPCPRIQEFSSNQSQEVFPPLITIDSPRCLLNIWSSYRNKCINRWAKESEKGTSRYSWKFLLQESGKMRRSQTFGSVEMICKDICPYTSSLHAPNSPFLNNFLVEMPADFALICRFLELKALLWIDKFDQVHMEVPRAPHLLQEFNFPPYCLLHL